VTIFQHGPQLLADHDPDVAREVERILQEEGIDVIAPSEILRVEGRSGRDVRVLVRSPSGQETIPGSDILVAVGRTPNTAGIGLDRVGVELDDAGYIKTDERLATTADRVWAMGECAGSPQFTHVAFDDFRVVRDNLHGSSRTTAGRLVPFCLFLDPELARVGCSETEARQRGLRYRRFTLPMAAVLRTRTLSEPRGFMKMLVAADSDEILGFTAFGTEASELMTAVQVAMAGQLPYTVLRSAILTHPTVAEGLTFLLSGTATVMEPTTP
jgi:pyruvate/2-oxoglutarate dehydrogenase complex dihydrolipoamide dehydrogenase (E3) component